MLSILLQPASFRGVPFEVEAAGVEVGRRVQVHEYPQRDTPWTEDLGRATRGFTVDAFVVGEDYIEHAKALMDAAEEEGPGTLVHPWLGTLQVSLKDLLRVRFDASLGHAVIGFSFVEAGELEFPAAADSTPSQSQLAADALCTSAIEDFAADFDIGGLPSFVGDMAGFNLASAIGFASTLGGNFSVLNGLGSLPGLGSLGGLGGLGNLGGLAGSFLGGSFTPLAGWASQLGGYVDAARSLISSPLLLGQSMMDWLDMSGIVASLSIGSASNGPTYATASAPTTGRSADPMAAMATGIVRLAGTGGAGGVFPAPMPSPTATPARQQLVTNTAAINALVRRGLLAQAVGISSHVDAAVQADAHTVRDALCSALDAESLLAGDVSYEALQTARRAVWTDLTVRSSDGARVVDLATNQVQPTLLLAYDLYEDAARESEIAARNGVVHPGFVPITDLQVLSR